MGSNTPSPTHREPTLPKCPLWAEADVMPVPLIGPLSARSRRTSPIFNSTRRIFSRPGKHGRCLRPAFPSWR